MPTKTLYKGSFNYQGEIHTIYRHAASTRQAYRLMIRALAKKLSMMQTPLANYFGDSDRYKITVEKEGEKDGTN